MKIKVAILGFIILLFHAFAAPAGAQDDSGAKIVSAVQYIQNGEYDKAQSLLSEVISSDPKSDAAWYYLGLCYANKSDVEMTEVCLRNAVDIDGSNYWYRYKLAALYALTKREELTIDIYEKLLVDFPKKSDLYFELVELYSSQGDYEKSLETIGEVEKVFGMTESLAIYRFNLLMHMKRQEEAYKSLEEYNSKYSSPYVLVALANQHLAEYCDSLALKCYDEALDLAPDYAPAVIGKAETFRVTSRYDEYFKVLADYMKLSSETAAEKSRYLSRVLQNSEPNFIARYKTGLDEAMENALEVHPSDSNVLSLAGLYYLSTERVDKASGLFRKNMEEHQSSSSTHQAYAEFLMYSGDWDSLANLGRESFEKFPDKFLFLELALMADRTLKRNKEALELCDKTLATSPSDTAVLVSLWSAKGDICYELNDQKSAFKAYEKALKYKPDYIYVLNNYAYFLCESGKKMKKACEMSRKTVEAEPDNATYLDTYGWILFKMGKPQEALKHFKRAMLYGGKDSAVILDHYAEVLFALKEYDRAMVYWNKALLINDGEIADLQERIQLRKQQKDKTR